MNTRPEKTSARLLKPLGITLAAVLVALVATSHQSFWMDEGNTVFKALMPGFEEFRNLLFHLRGSDVQMPVYMFLVWCWEKAGAESEYVFRLVNLPWVVMGALALSRFKWWPVCFLLSPFLWFYAGELRPYAMQLAAGAVATLAWIRVSRAGVDGKEFGGLHEAAVAAVLLAGSSLTGAVWAFGLWVGLLVLRGSWLKTRGFWLRIAPWLLAVLPLAGYYAYTLVEGYRAASLGGGGLMGFLFGFYELLGLVGLGPGRNGLRTNLPGIVPFLPFLVPAGVLIAGVWFTQAWRWQKSVGRRQVVAAALAIGIPLVFFLGISVAMDFRVLGRHLSPLLPLILLPLATALDGGPGRPVLRLAAAGCLLFALASSLLIRFAERHARDDYRAAAAFAFEALEQGKRVMWKADMNATRYYAWRKGGLPYVSAIQRLESDPPSSLLMADVVIVNRPDVYARQGDYRHELRENLFELEATPHGFEIWTYE